MNKLIILVLLLGILFLSGCVENNTGTNTAKSTDYQITRYHDVELNVTCWITDSTTQFGVEDCSA